MGFHLQGHFCLREEQPALNREHRMRDEVRRLEAYSNQDDFEDSSTLLSAEPAQRFRARRVEQELQLAV